MPKMTTCPKSHFVQGDKLSLRRYHLCLSLQNAYKFGQKLANFQVQTHHYFFVIKKPIILLKFVGEYECQILGLKKSARHLGKFSP